MMEERESWEMVKKFGDNALMSKWGWRKRHEWAQPEWQALGQETREKRHWPLRNAWLIRRIIPTGIRGRRRWAGCCHGALCAAS